VRKHQAFTLIELLIVVAIIAILALIAVPNFLEAQVRSKVSRTKADMRSLAVALQAYRIDWPMYPPDVDSGAYNSLGLTDRWGDEIASYHMITTPVAYISSIPKDVFWQNSPGTPQGQARKDEAFFEYSEDQLHGPMAGTNRTDLPTWARMQATQCGFVMISMGPDRYADFTWRAQDWETVGYDYTNNRTLTNSRGSALGYDPTNGTISKGDIICSAKGFYPR
jgi:prepilin-type N-terminal cleavage/methylation domain-containing protein